MIVAIDFDGTIVENAFPQIGKLRYGAADTMRRLRKEGHKIILWTCRCDDRLTDAVNFMLQNDLPFDAVNDNLLDVILTYGSNSRKVNADMYIDDKAAGGVDWERIYFDLFHEPIDTIFP